MCNLNIDIVNNILQTIKNLRNIDFFDYKINTILRRLNQRIIVLNLKTIEEYYDYFKKNVNEECNKLLELFFINTTEFFRDPLYFNYFETLCKSKVKRGANYIKILSVGCSSGEEIYTVAMILNEMKQKEEDFDFYILAIDIDEDAIESAKNAIYAEYSMKNVPYYYLKKYFITEKNKFFLKKDLFEKDNIEFRHQNILKDNKITISGILKYDFVFCRNILIYFNKETQYLLLKKIIEILDKDGYIILGKNEHLHTKLQPYFQQVCPNIRIFRFKSGSYQ